MLKPNPNLEEAMVRKVLFDCDTGGDDATAMCLGVASRDIEVLGVSACMGNLELRQTLRNALHLMEFLGREDIPVAKGSEKPLVRELWVGDKNERPLPIPGLEKLKKQPHQLDAVEFMAKVLRESDTKVDLIPLAPLTNIAKLMMFHPDLVREKVGNIVLMGGAMYFGNVTAAAELNFYADPEAAKCVFNFGMPIVMVGLEVCEKAYLCYDDLEKIKAAGTKPAEAFYNIVKQSLDTYGSRYAEANGEKARVYMYDSITVVYLLHPEIFTTVKAKVRVEANSSICDGMTVCDTREYGVDPAEKTTTVVLDCDREKYVQLVAEILKEAK